MVVIFLVLICLPVLAIMSIFCGIAEIIRAIREPKDKEAPPMSELKLLPCPFSGGEAAVCDIKEPSVNGWVGCQRCRCFINWVKNGKSLAIAAWNRRAQPENAPLTLDELRQMKESKDPVWISKSKQWIFVLSVADAPYAQVWYFTAKGMGHTVLYHHETFYRRKPERSEG